MIGLSRDFLKDPTLKSILAKARVFMGVGYGVQVILISFHFVTHI